MRPKGNCTGQTILPPPGYVGWTLRQDHPQRHKLSRSEVGLSSVPGDSGKDTITVRRSEMEAGEPGPHQARR